MSRYYGYVRVSTVKQGEKGVSLQEQRDAITRYAEKNRLTMIDWFEERETAAKRGRPVFGQMLKQLRAGRADGVIIHKIDRSARNLKDWSDLGDLIDGGIEIHFANEGLDLHSRGGRLSADIQAVVAADYIRNLREEAKKGIYGRLKQGIWPLPAPVGYLDRGAGKPKEPDPLRAPLITKSFELYATGRFSLDTLIEEMYRRGLRNTKGGKVGRNGFSRTLNNPFYMGLLRIRRTGQTFDGVHQPIVSKAVFDRVQDVLRGKFDARTRRHEFIFRKLIKCSLCGYTLIGELQKGRVYYRCQTKGCATKSAREDRVLEDFRKALEPLRFSPDEVEYFRLSLEKLRADWDQVREKEAAAVELQLAQLRDRLNRLTDLYVDASLDAEMYEERKTSLLSERKGLEGRLNELKEKNGDMVDRVGDFLELAKSLWLSLETGQPEEIREIVQNTTSNRLAGPKNVEFKLSIPFRTLAERPKTTHCGPKRDAPRTLLQFYLRLAGAAELFRIQNCASSNLGVLRVG